MTKMQKFLKLIADAGRILSAITAASDLEREFERRVKAMLEGTEKPVTPKEIDDFSEAIENAKEREPEEWQKLNAKLLEIDAFANKYFNEAEP